MAATKKKHISKRPRVARPRVARPSAAPSVARPSVARPSVARQSIARPSSEVPVDLRKQRETFVRTFLKKGVELTEALLEENRTLNGELAKMRADNARLRKQVASDGAIRDLIRSIDSLEREKNELLTRSSELVEQSEKYVGRQAEIEQELSDLANLYVASVQLHNRLSPRAVLQHLKELLAQLVGAEAFVVYLADATGQSVVPVGAEGVNADNVGPVVVGEGVIGEACLTGVTWMSHDEPLSAGTVVRPLAVIPLRLETRCVGAIAILSMLEQKAGWAPVDHELFKLLGDQAAIALAGAHLFSRVRGPLEALAGLTETL